MRDNFVAIAAGFIAMPPCQKNEPFLNDRENREVKWRTCRAGPEARISTDQKIQEA